MAYLTRAEKIKAIFAFPEAYHDLPEDPEFVVRLKYLQYNRREELRICEAMDEKGRTIIERFNSTHESN